MIKCMKWFCFCAFQCLYLTMSISYGDQSVKQQLPMPHDQSSIDIDDTGVNKNPVTDWKDKITLDKRGTHNIPEFIRMDNDGEKRNNWNNLSGMWGKREATGCDDDSSREKRNFKKNWNGLQGMWGKRNNWNNLSGMWGKRADWNNLSGMWGKREGIGCGDEDSIEKRNSMKDDKKNFKKNWNGLRGMWGKRSAWNDYNGMQNDRLTDDSQLVDENQKRTQWNNLNGMWGKRGSWNNLNGMWGKRSDWNNLSGMWGKKSDWNNLSGMWGKRNDWNNLSGMWGKRNDWNNLSGMWGKRSFKSGEDEISKKDDKKNFKKNWNGLRGMWGKRSAWDNYFGMRDGRLINPARLADDNEKRTQWNNLNGMWGKRNSDSHIYFEKPDILEEEPSVQDEV